ncbi:hypothetical protein [Maricurvus nonylphenolicus]|uniref:hypothetical protein n=1 Tax=Maricurvus nonylphenolicus TaxID=1008307 RepID=UPI0036F34BB4
MSKEFINLFDYEIQNRAFALASMEALVRTGDVNPNLEFFKAYLELEKLNQKKFSPVASKHQLSVEPRWWTRTRTRLGMCMSNIMPETSLKVIHKATVKYVAQLQALEAVSPEQDKAFFAYVVAQEQAQADAVGLLLAGEPDQGTALLTQFIAENAQ